MGCLILLVLSNLALWLLLWAALASEIDGGPGVWGSGGFLLELLVVLRFWPWCLGCAGQRPSWTFGSVCCPSASVAFWALLSLTTSAGWLKLYLHAGISHWCALWCMFFTQHAGVLSFVVLGFMTFGSGDLGEVDGVDLSLQHKFPHWW